MDISNLLLHIQETHSWFSRQAARQINTALTLRNWVIGMYLRVYEHEGKDRAQYGEKILSEISLRLKTSGHKGMSERSLRVYRYFYDCYPQIWQTLSAKFQTTDNQHIKSKRLRIKNGTGPVFQTTETPGTNPEILLNRLTFSHFIELLNCDSPLKRLFYETEATVNNWSVRELRRAMDSLLFERTGLSVDKQKVLEKHRSGTGLNPADVIKDPYVFEFLGLHEKPEYTESRIEQAIIDHLQQFLLEAGKGFCFEARQRRISFDNRHYRIDLVFYHRILRCHVLFDLKIGPFDHADAGQMNVYLNYYKEHEMVEGDLPPVGVILCSEKNQALVHYATGGLPQQVFASKYLLNLPTEEELKSIVMAEQEKSERNSMYDKSLSKFLSLVLRHRPETIGIELDANGWVTLDLLVEKMREHGKKVSLAAIQDVVAHNDKQRFALDMHRRRIRANQGHSVPIDLQLPPVEPPELLYHGTAAKNIGLIAAKGLIKGRRHHVHLSPDTETATRVGGRHGAPVVLIIRAREMHEAGFDFFVSANGVWLTNHVPVEFIDFAPPAAPASSPPPAENTSPPPDF